MFFKKKFTISVKRLLNKNHTFLIVLRVIFKCWSPNIIFNVYTYVNEKFFNLHDQNDVGFCRLEFRIVLLFFEIYF